MKPPLSILLPTAWLRPASAEVGSLENGSSFWSQQTAVMLCISIQVDKKVNSKNMKLNHTGGEIFFLSPWEARLEQAQVEMGTLLGSQYCCDLRSRPVPWGPGEILKLKDTMFFSPFVLESANSTILYPKQYTLRENKLFWFENIPPESELSQIT